MADTNKAVSENVGGDFFVDLTCINCDTCRQLAPATFKDQGDYSFVYAQPADRDEKRAATRALLCCPTGSIGTRKNNEAGKVMEDLPLLLEDDVYYCGFNSPKSYGGNSFLVRHADGNWLIDSPKYLPHLVKQFKELGGIKYIFLTHQDDVAEAARYAEQFSATRIIHKFDARAQSDSEMIIDGSDEVEISPEFRIIPTAGHTRGHMVLLYKNKFLFTGDHLAFDAELNALVAFRRHCWYSWEEQIVSMERLRNYKFEWVLAGHGNRAKRTFSEMQGMLADLIEKMRLPEAAWNAYIADS